MKTKYRIRKYVLLDKILGRKEDGLSIIYFIDKKSFLSWNVMTNFLGYEQDGFGFNTIEQAKAVLKKHIELERELSETGKIIEVIDGSEV